MSDVAGLTNERMRWIHFRSRDQYGHLIRAEAGRHRFRKFGLRHKGSTFERMFKDLWTARGLTEDKVEQRWQLYLKNNPRLKHVFKGKK